MSSKKGGFVNRLKSLFGLNKAKAQYSDIDDAPPAPIWDRQPENVHPHDFCSNVSEKSSTNSDIQDRDDEFNCVSVAEGSSKDRIFNRSTKDDGYITSSYEMNNRQESKDTGARPKTKSTSTNTEYYEEHDKQGLLPSEADDEQTGLKKVMLWDDGSFDRFHPLRASSSEPDFKSPQFFAQRKHLPRPETAKKNVAETPIKSCEPKDIDSGHDDVFEGSHKTCSKQIKYVVHSPQNCNFGGANSENSVSFTRHSSADLQAKVQGQTELALKEVWNEDTETINGVKTNLYKKAKEKLERPRQKQVLIIKGEGLGCDYVAKMIFAETCQNKTTGFYLNDVNDWVVANGHIRENDRGVVLILNANLNDWTNIIKHQMLPSANRGEYLTVIITTNTQVTDTALHNFVLDASDQYAHPTEEDQKQVFEIMAKQKSLRIIPGHVDMVQVATRNRRSPTMTTYTKEKILRTIGKHMWVRRLNAFFTGTMGEASLFFRKPDPKLVEDFRNKIESNNRSQTLQLFCLLVIYVFGTLDKTGISRLKNLQSLPNGKYFQSAHNIHSNVKVCKRKIKAYPQLKLIVEYCNDFYDLKHFINNIYDGLKTLRDILLIETVDLSDQFSGEYIRTSLMVAINEVIPEGIIESCDDDFLFDFVRDDERLNKFEYSLIRNETVLEVFFKRMRFQWQQNMKRCMKHPVLVANFEKFLKLLKRTSHLRWFLLKNLDDSKKYCALYYGIDSGAACNGNYPTPTEVILTEGKWTQKRNANRWKSFTREQEALALVHAAQLANKRVFTVLENYGAIITKEALVAALKSNAIDIIEYCLTKADLAENEWLDCLFESIKQCSCSPSNEGNLILEKLMSARKVSFNINCTEIIPLLHRIVNNQKMLEIFLEGSWGRQVDVNAVHKYDDGGKTALVIATELGHYETIKYLLDKGANQRTEGAYQRPIVIAVKKGQLKIVQALVNENPDVLAEPGIDGEYPIVIACRNGCIDVVEYMANYNRRCLETLNKMGQTLIHIATEAGKEQVVNFLLKPEMKADICALDARGFSPMLTAAKCDKTTCLQVLLRTALQRRLPQDNSLIVHCIDHQNSNLLGTLIEEFKYNMNVCDTKHGPPLSLAVQKNDIKIVKLMLKDKTDVNIRCSAGFQPIHLASATGNVELLLLLIESGASIDSVQSVTSDTIIHIAAAHNKHQFIEYVFMSSEVKSVVIDVNSVLIDRQNKQGETALHVAVKGGHVESVRALLHCGFQKFRFDKKSMTPGQIAARLSKETNSKSQRTFQTIVRYLDS